MLLMHASFLVIAGAEVLGIFTGQSARELPETFFFMIEIENEYSWNTSPCFETSMLQWICNVRSKQGQGHCPCMQYRLGQPGQGLPCSRLDTAVNPSCRDSSKK